MPENAHLKDRYSRIVRRDVEAARRIKVSPEPVLLEKHLAKSRWKGMTCFHDAVRNRRAADKDNRKTIGYFCNAVPEELILACGMRPARLCSEDRAWASRGEEIMPSDVCPVVKSSCGDLLSGGYAGLDLLVIPATCDGKLKMGEICSAFTDVHFIDLPRDSDCLKNADIWCERYREFFRVLKKRSNTNPSRKDLLAKCVLANRRTETFRRIHDLRLKHPGAINALDYFIMAEASFSMDIEAWTRNAALLHDEVQKEVSRGKGGAAESARLRVDGNGKKDMTRLVLAGSPLIYPNYKILEILEEAGCDVACDTTCSAYGRLYDPVIIDEDTDDGILRALALKYIAASMCPCFLGVDKLVDRIIQLFTENELDGVLFHNMRLCQVYEIEAMYARKVLKEQKIPFLLLKTDLGREETGQIKTRIEAFIEVVKANG